MIPSPLAFEDLKALVLLNLLGERRKVVECFEQGVKPSEMIISIDKEWLKNFDPEKEIEACEKRGVRLLTWFDEDYPRLLKEIYDPPLVLYMRGSFEKTDEAALAIVGTRHPSLYGLEQAKRFSRELAQAGLTIISGFAKGIDQAAHEAAVEVSYGRTIAVLGCGIDVDYPRGSGKLFQKIAERGAVISDYPLGTQPRAENFPKRNRIISGLSLGVLVIEAAMRSGSLITAHEAADYGREVFALPGPVDRPTSGGAHHLIKEGAALAETPFDVLEALAPMLHPIAGLLSSAQGKAEEEKIQKPSSADQPAPHLGHDADNEEQRLIEALAAGPLAFDEVASKSSLPCGRLASLLTQLELKKKIQKRTDGRFVL